MKKTKQLVLGLLLLFSGVGTLQAQECPSNLFEGKLCLPVGFPVEAEPERYQLNLTEGHTRLSHEVHDLHMLIFWICVAVGIGVFGVMFYSIYHHRKSKGHVAKQFHENTLVEFIWTVIPAAILIAMAIPATKTMMELDDVTESDMTIKVTGWQWKWEYDYLDNGIHFFSVLDDDSNKARKLGADVDVNNVPHYLLKVDEPVVVPIKKKIRFVFTANDVLHSWWVPDLGWKKDAIPGFINEAWASVDDPGIYRGKCTELCGKDHAFMPVVVVAMEQKDYDAWTKAKVESASAGDSVATESHDELVKNGAEVFAKNCATCHMPDGAGIPGAFPALKGSKVVNGDIKAQANLIINGKNAMPAFAKQLQAKEIAEVITYTRNALTNSMGDEIQPKDIAAMIGGGKPKAAGSSDEGKPQTKAGSTVKSEAKVATAATHSSQEIHSKATRKAEDSVDDVQFAGDKFYPQKRLSDEKVSANDQPKTTGATGNKASNAGAGNVALEELAKHGADVYATNCQSCHQKEGVGMPPAFPALQGSKIVTGKIDGQIEIMLKGKGMMPSFAKTLSAKDFAAVLAYTRNKLGSNATGDFKQPSEIETLQAASE